ncbi:MAG TPA: Gfo/Idh/MocA family oxidoreductase [Fimbriimonadaceae bacterium]|nr:Gfo/Idh/MocA family oxidoreductase [Fimbriimonadaceae bacterium]
MRQSWPLPAEKRPIVAVGAGAIVRHAHWPAYKLAGFEVASVFDVDTARARSLAADFGVPHVCASLSELVESAPPEAVFDLATPANSIREILAKIPEDSGVLIQKPMGENLEQAEEIVRIVRERNLVAAVNFQLRYAPYALAARDLVEEVVGDIYEVEFKVNVHTPWELWDFLEKAPRMEIVYHSIHYLDFIRSLLGEPERVLASTMKHPSSPRLHSSRSVIALEYGENTRAVVTTNHAHDFGTKHQESYCRVEGSKGCVRFQMGLNMNYPEGLGDTLEYCLRGTSNWLEVPLSGSWFPEAFIGPMSALMRCLAGEQDTMWTEVADALKTMELVERCYVAAIGTPRHR